MNETATEITGAMLAEMESEVEAYCREKGWYDTEVPMQTALALLHEEAAEAGSAWRDHGLRDVTYDDHPEFNPGGVACDVIVKPEGVGSELADLLIRLLDDSTRYELGLAARIERRSGGVYALSGDFLTEVNTLHDMISLASITWGEGGSRYPDHLVGLYRFLVQMAGYYGIDLHAEYTRKMQYNRTRPYRHGGKRA